MIHAHKLFLRVIVTMTWIASMTVVENVQLAAISAHGQANSLRVRAAQLHREEALALLARVGMAKQADRACGVLAYGDLKRVELAIALANRRAAARRQGWLLPCRYRRGWRCYRRPAGFFASGR